MRKDIKKGDWDFEMMREFWSIYRKFYIPEDTEEYWSNLVNACVNFMNKFDTKFAKNLCMDVYDELGRRYNQMYRKGSVV